MCGPFSFVPHPGIALTIALGATDNVLKIVGQLASAAGSLRQAIRISFDVLSVRGHKRQPSRQAVLT